MDAERFSAIAHRDHVYCNPLSSVTIESALDMLALREEERVLDVGCGKAELLCRLVERFGVHALGLDLSEAMLTEARTRLEGRDSGRRIELRAEDASGTVLGPGEFALAACLGASHALGGYGAALVKMAEWVRPGGHLLVGEGYWKKTPSPEYLQFLGATQDELLGHEGNQLLAEDLGFTVLHASLSSDSDWDAYEGLYAESIESHVREHPEDPDAVAMLARIRPWKENFEKHGRATLGFALYLFRV